MAFLKRLYLYLFVWDFPRVASDAEMRTVDAVVTQSLEPVSWGDGLLGNKLLAKTAVGLREKYGLPLLAQEEVARAILSIKCIHIAYDPNKKGDSTTSWNTYEVAKLQKEFCDEKGWKAVIVVAHPDHMMRAVAVYRKLGMEVMAALMPKDRRSYYYQGSFRQCRGFWSYFTEIRRKFEYGPGFRWRERLTRLLFWYWGYI